MIEMISHNTLSFTKTCHWDLSTIYWFFFIFFLAWKYSGKHPHETTFCYKDWSMREQSKPLPSFHSFSPRASHCPLSRGGHTTQLSVNYPPQSDLVAGKRNSYQCCFEWKIWGAAQCLPYEKGYHHSALHVEEHSELLKTFQEENPLSSIIILKTLHSFASYVAWMPLRAACFKMPMDIYQFEVAKATAWEWL